MADDRLKVSLDQLDQLGLGEMEEMLEFGLKQRAELKMEEEIVKERIKTVNDTVLPLMIGANIGSVSSSLGTLAWSHRVNRSINRDKLVNAMLAAGIKADKINQIVEEATTVSESDTLSFTKSRG